MIKIARKKSAFILKILLCLSIVFTMTYAKPKSEMDQAEAVAPLIAAAGAAAVALVAKELGWKFVGKPAWNALKKKILAKILKNPQKYGLGGKKSGGGATGSWGKTTLKKNGKNLELEIDDFTKKKIATLIKEEGTTVIQSDKDRQSVTKPTYDLDYTDVDPFFYTSVTLDYSIYTGTGQFTKGTDMLQRFFDVKFTPVPFERRTIIKFISTVDGSSVEKSYAGGSTGFPKKYTLTGNYVYPYFYIYDMTNGLTINNSNPISGATLKAYESYLLALQNSNSRIYIAQGVMVPEDNVRIYDVHEDLSYEDFVNVDVVKSQPTKIIIPLPDNTDDTVVEYDDWEQISSEYETSIINKETEISDSFDSEVTNNYDYQVTNNYYTADPGEKTVEEIKNEIIINIENNVDVPVVDPTDPTDPGTDTTVDSPMEVPKTFFKEMQEIGGYIADTYNGLVLFFQVATDGFKSLTDGMTGFVSFLDTFFEWLPNEYKALLGSGFALGVVSFFLRR